MKTQSKIFQNIKNFQAYLGKRIFIILGLTMLAGVAEGFGILMLLPLFQSLDSLSGSNEQSGIALTFINQSLAFFDLDNSILAILIIISLTFLLKGLLTFISLAYSATLRGKFLRLLKKSMFSSVSNIEYVYYSTRDTGNLINIINEQINRAMQSFYYLTLSLNF